MVMNRHEILKQLDSLEFPVMSKHPSVKDNKRKRAPNWTKKWIFFDLPYRSRLLIRHKLDVIHIEKNVCDNLVYTLLNIEEKSKDTMNARLDLQYFKLFSCIKHQVCRIPSRLNIKAQHTLARYILLLNALLKFSKSSKRRSNW